MCRFLDNDGHCAFHSDAEVKEYCVAGPCPDMQTYKELADALRKAGSDTQYYEAELYDDAADAIERLQKQNEELQAENATYRKLILLSAGEINELRYKLHLDEMDIEEIKLP